MSDDYTVVTAVVEGEEMKGHTLYETGDPGAPDVIKDGNGEVCLGLCKVCGRAEAELVEPCVPREKPKTYHGTYIGPQTDLIGDTALLLPDEVNGGWLAQFDAADDPVLCFGWHHFPAEHFHIEAGLCQNDTP
jgi:hypothetical protein